MKLTGDIDKIENLQKNVSAATQYILLRVSQNVIINNAKINAPYLSWDLHDSIGWQFDKIQQGIVIVWSDMPYSRRREYENYAHPQRRYYLWRAYSEHLPEIRQTIVESLFNKLK